MITFRFKNMKAAVLRFSKLFVDVSKFERHQSRVILVAFATMNLIILRAWLMFDEYILISDQSSQN